MVTNEIKTPSLLIQRIKDLQPLAVENGWMLEWEVQTATGVIHYSFVQVTFTNMYSNITNVVIRATPIHLAGAKTIPSLLLAAHYDSAFSSPGASDDGASLVVR